MGKKKGAPVVIVRKDKKLTKTGHALAFLLTGGTSSVYTAAKAATNAGYNARTRKLMAEAEAAEAPEEARARELARSDEKFRRMVADANMKRYDDPQAEWRAEHVPASKEYKERHGQ
jgi:hypothetical protein